MRAVVRRLELAHTADRQLELPWREWAELAGFAELPTPPDVLERSEHASEPPIGYRRHDLVYTVNGWRIELPGALQVGQEDGAWTAWDQDRSVHLTAHRFAADTPRADWEEAIRGERITADSDRVERTAGIWMDIDDGVQTRILVGLARLGTRLAHITVTGDENAPDEWLVSPWRTLRWIGD